ncbi:MAG: hypothetical protein ACLT5P_14465 [Flavonifractor plautii]
MDQGDVASCAVFTRSSPRNTPPRADRSCQRGEVLVVHTLAVPSSPAMAWAGI